jgi:3'(2'), 5'-bisphosphate nucleotidase
MIASSEKKKVGAALKKVGKWLASHKKNPEFTEIISLEGLKTKADIEANKLLFRYLSLATPSIPIFSEELAHSISDRPKKYWLIDPIDGTASWLSGFEGYVSQLALINDNQPELGMIYWPERDRLYSSSADGVFLNNKRLSQPSLNVPPIVIDNYPYPQGIAAVLLSRMSTHRYIECGSLGLKTIRTLAGEADIFVKSTLVRDWDMAPAMAFQRFGWGAISNLRGQQLRLGQSIEFEQGLVVSHDCDATKDTVKLLADQVKGRE